MSKLGVLLTNTGTPDAPTPSAVRRYLREFLSDKRIVKLPRIVWLPILYSLILTLRPRKSAKLYQAIWQVEGSPMRFIMENIVKQLRKKVDINTIAIEMGMNYGNPSIETALTKLKNENIEALVILPLFPQYSNTTTASSLDQTLATLKKWPYFPGIHFIKHYGNQHDYIQGLAFSVLNAWSKRKRAQHLLISFHGIPERFVKSGDPYATECEETANLLAKALNLQSSDWTLCYQSQFGYDKWLKPSTQDLLIKLPKQGIKHIDIICPGFSVDCLETLEEIAKQGHKDFILAGGESFHYIPALNNNPEQINFVAKMIQEYSLNSHKIV